jgi:DNA polymerase-4/DNA polymerase V
MELSVELRKLFVDMYHSKDIYRATGIVLLELSNESNLQYGLFEDAITAEKVLDLYKVVDEVNAKFGKHNLHLGASHFIEVFGRGRRGETTAREKTSFFGETKRKHLGIPILQVKV